MCFDVLIFYALNGFFFLWLNSNYFSLQYGRQHIEVAKKLKRVDSFEEENEKETSKSDGMSSFAYFESHYFMCVYFCVTYIFIYF